jgi:hypothetical protein
MEGIVVGVLLCGVAIWIAIGIALRDAESEPTRPALLLPRRRRLPQAQPTPRSREATCEDVPSHAPSVVVHDPDDYPPANTF